MFAVIGYFYKFYSIFLRPQISMVPSKNHEKIAKEENIFFERFPSNVYSIEYVIRSISIPISILTPILSKIGLRNIVSSHFRAI